MCEKVKYGWVGEGAGLGEDSMSYYPVRACAVGVEC